MPSLTRLLIALLLFSGHIRAFAEQVGIIFNNDYKGTISLRFDAATPCLTRPLLEEWGVELERFSASIWTRDGCLSPLSFNEIQLKYWYRPQAGLLTLLLPSGWVSPQKNGVSTSRWDDGITAAFVNYRVRANRDNRKYAVWGENTNASFDVDNGVNIGPWRLRYNHSVWHDKRGQWGNYNRERYIARSITALRARLTAGDGSSSGQQFASIGFTGVSLASDEAMYPDSWRPFSPWINGYARTNAEVSIYQNGAQVYRIKVRPGTFSIRDFYPPSPSGSLELVIQENDGTERRRTLPYSSMPNMVRQGFFSFESLAGRYRSSYASISNPPIVLQTSAAWGLLPHLTLFGGVQKTRDYLSVLLGAGTGFRNWGALSLDLTQARYHNPESAYQGSVGRLRYARAFMPQQASLNAMLLWYPHKSRFRTAGEKIEADGSYFGYDDGRTDRRWGAEVQINKILSDDSSITLTWLHAQNRRHKTANSELTLDYSGTLHNLDLSISAGFARNDWAGDEGIVRLNFSLPFTLGQGSATAGYGLDYTSHDFPIQRASLSGNALKDYRLRYEAAATREKHGESGYSVSTGYLADGNESNVAFERTGTHRSWSLDSQGSVVLHSGGITFGQTLGETAGLVEIPDTAGAGVYNQFAVRSNKKGQILVSDMTPWRINRVTLDTFTLPGSTTVEVDELDVVPTWGAIVRTRFEKPQPESEDTH